VKIKFSILGKPWKLRTLGKKEYSKKHGGDSIAITHVHKRYIDLSPKGTDRATIIHECVHAWLSEICTHSADLDEQCSEEIFAELMAKFGYQILAQAEDLFWRLK
jgi:hypothetical protein